MREKDGLHDDDDSEESFKDDEDEDDAGRSGLHARKKGQGVGNGQEAGQMVEEKW